MFHFDTWFQKLALVLLFVLALAVPVAAQTVVVGDIAPDFTLYDYGLGRPVHLTDYAGKIVVLNIVATNKDPCPLACSEVQAQIQNYYAALGGNAYGLPVVVLDVCMNTDSVASFVSTYGLTPANVLIDYPNPVVFYEYSNGWVPQFAIINGAIGVTGIPQWQVVGEPLPGYLAGDYMHLRPIINSIGAGLTTKLHISSSPSGAGIQAVTPSQAVYAPNTVVTITTSAKTGFPGYAFASWTVVGGSVTSSTAAMTALTMTGTACTVTASYVQTPYTVTVITPTGGTVTISPTYSVYYYSNSTTITGSGFPGYKFVSWSVTGGTVASKTLSHTQLTVKGNVSLSASFGKIAFSDTLTNVGGTIQLTPSHGPFYLGTVVGVSATPSAGWQFVNWSATGASLTSATASTTSLTVLGNFALKAIFSAITYGVSGVASPTAGGTVSVGSATGTIGRVISISQTTNAGYGFIKWLVNDGGHGAKLNSGSAAITLGSSNVTVTASYAVVYSDTLTNVGGGTLRLTLSHGPYYYGTVVGLTASAGPGWQFVNWTTTGGSVISASSATTSLTVVDNFDVTANFSAIIYGVSGVASPAADGSVSVGSATGTIGQVVSLSQTANAGYAFIGWKVSDGGHGAKLNSDSASLTFGSSNVTVTGSFTLIHYPLVVHQQTGGAVTLSPSQATYIYSQSGTLTATAKPGYSFVDWLVTGGSVASGTASKTVLTVTSTCSVTPSYYEFFYSSTLTNIGDGTIFLSSDGPYPYGQVVTVTALPEPEYAFKGWIVTGSGTLVSKTAATTALTVHGEFSLTASYAYIGQLATLCSFTGSNGACPWGSLTLSGSTLYGMTQGDEDNNYGTIFSIPTSGGSPTILYSFSGTPDGATPWGSLTLSGSTLYGMTSVGGANDNGTVFSLPISGGTPTILYSFSYTTDGGNPYGSLALSGSTLYGMTAYGGNMSLNYGDGAGTVFSIPTSGGLLTTLCSFNGSNGSWPYGSLTLSGSTLYGMTTFGGSGYTGYETGYGTIFSLPTSGGSPTVLYSFSDANDGANPEGSLTLSGSTLYGMTSCYYANGYGSVFSLPTIGGTPTVLCSFDGVHGAGPGGDLTLSGSTLYGMTYEGGNMSLDGGTIFSIPTRGGSPTILFSFDGVHGKNPGGDLTLSGSTLYGMAYEGGNMSLNGGDGDGTVFRLPVTVPHQYTLTVTPPTGGTVTVNPDQATYSPNALVSITAVANTGSNFVSWTVVGGTVASKTSSQTLLTVTGNVTLSASFHKTSYSDTLADVGGKIQMTPSHGPYYYGTVVGITASTNAGWQFVSWSSTGATLTSSDDITTSMTVLGNFDLTATFSAITYGVSGVANPTAGGTVSVGSATGTIGRVISISRTANTGYGFTGWTIDDGGHGAKFNSGSASITLGSSNVTVTAGFALIHYPVTVRQSSSGAVTLTPTQATYTYSQTGTLTATPTASYNFVSWSVTGGSVGSSTASQTVFTVTSTCSVTASYHKIVYSDTLADIGGGKILMTPSHGPYYLGTVVGLTASANPGWQFVSWSATGASLTSSSAKTASLTVLGNFDLTAKFGAIIYSVSGVASPAAGGTVSVGSATGTIGQVVSISQTANAGYGFIKWTMSDGGHGAKFNSGSTSITLGSSNVTVTASYQVVYSSTLTDIGNGTITLSNSGPYAYGQVVTATASAHAGFVFEGWSLTGSCTLSNSAAVSTSLTVHGSFTLTAKFDLVPTILGSFSGIGGANPGGNPFGALALSGSKLYGLTENGGSNGLGTIFSISASGGPETVLYNFDGSGHGANPYGSLVLSGSTLYGMTCNGGAHSFGTIFSIAAGGPSTPKVLFNFDSTNGANPLNGTLAVSGSTLYGMTQFGGLNNDGVIFSITSSGPSTPTILYNFNAADGSPGASLTLSGSTLFGTTYQGGDSGFGTVFSIATSGGTPTVLYSFDGTHGAGPRGDLTLSGSTLYGMTEYGGNGFAGPLTSGYGVIFSLPASGPGTPTILASFTGSGGAFPGANPVVGSLTLNGSTMYGMASAGGANNYGDIFSIPIVGGTPTILYTFEGAHGANPNGALMLNGTTLYGMAVNGGTYGIGTMFSLPAP